MPVAGEELRLKVFGIMRTSAHKALRELRVEGLSPQGAERLLDEVIAIEKAMASLKVLIADRAAEAGGWRARGARSPEEDLARRSGTSTGRAKDTLSTAKQAKKHPAIESALQDGKLSSEQVSEITSAAEANPAAAGRLVDDAETMSLAELRDTCGRVKAAADADADATNRRIHRERFLRYRKGPDGAVNGAFKLTPQAGAVLDAILQPFITAEARRAKQAGRHDTLDQLSADALVTMAQTAVHGPASKTTKPKVHVIVDRDALLRGSVEGEERCEISTCFGPLSIPVSVAQEIMGDAFLSGVFRDGVDVMSYVSFGRHVPEAVRDALLIRADFTCSVQGCTRRARLEIDHIEPFAQGGPTRMTNTEPKCDHHHQQKTNQDRQRSSTARAGPAP